MKNPHSRMQIDWSNRGLLATPAEMTVLERYATQPANFRSRKPCRLIWLYTRGVSRKEIIADLRISIETLERYFECWFLCGVPGLVGGGMIHRDQVSHEVRVLENRAWRDRQKRRKETRFLRAQQKV